MPDIKHLTTLCYIEKDDAYLMMHRVSKKNDINHDKWIGVGGHFKEGESPEECLLREVMEETGLTLASWHFRGIVIQVNTCICIRRRLQKRMGKICRTARKGFSSGCQRKKYMSFPSGREIKYSFGCLVRMHLSFP